MPFTPRYSLNIANRQSEAVKSRSCDKLEEVLADEASVSSVQLFPGSKQLNIADSLIYRAQKQLMVARNAHFAQRTKSQPEVVENIE